MSVAFKYGAHLHTVGIRIEGNYHITLDSVCGHRLDNEGFALLYNISTPRVYLKTPVVE